MRKVISAVSVLALVAALLAAAFPTAVAAAATCTATGFYRDSIDLTAAVIGNGTTVTGSVDATGCNIGVYFDSSHTGSVSRADIYGANYFGVVVNGGSVDVTDSSIHDIGEVPFNGEQHGVAVYYAYGSTSTGTVAGNDIWNYQKGGIVANGIGASVTITGNTVTGLGLFPLNAQNGIQVGWGAAATITGNTVTGNIYTQGAATGYVASGILLYQASLTTNVGAIASSNHSYGNQANILYVK